MSVLPFDASMMIDWISFPLEAADETAYRSDASTIDGLPPSYPVTIFLTFPSKSACPMRTRSEKALPERLQALINSLV